MSAVGRAVGPAARALGRAAGADEAHGLPGSPRAVTRGESQAAQVASVDWLNATFDAPAFSVEGFIALLGRMLGRPLAGRAKGGMFGFTEAVELVAGVGSKSVAMGCIAKGGEAQRGRWLLQFTGTGCGLVRDWEGMQDLLESLEARITRLDLAVDCYAGEYTVDDCVQWHELGGFTSAGRAPSTSVAGDWIGGVNGRTLYVGKSVNGKMLRCYEKGIEQGDFESEWVRFEVQFGNRDRVIPYEALTRRDAYFAGAYPCLQELVEEMPARIATSTQAGETSLAHLLFHLRRCYGRVLDTLSRECATAPAALVEAVRVVGFPRRVNPSSVAAGLTGAQVLARLKEYLK